MPVKKGTTTKRTVAKKAVKPDLKDFLEEVKKKAFEVYQERIQSGVAGDDIADWFQAEKEIKAKYKL
jgi:hypothetical protein